MIVAVSSLQSRLECIVGRSSTVYTYTHRHREDAIHANHKPAVRDSRGERSRAGPMLRALPLGSVWERSAELWRTLTCRAWPMGAHV